MNSPASVAEAVRDLIAGWVPTQRWFAGKGREFTLTATRLAELTPSPQVTIWIAHVAYAEGDTENYQVPLVARAEPQASLEHVLLGSIETGSGMRWVYDALHDKDVTAAWLAGIGQATGDVPAGDGVRFARYADEADLPIGQDSLVLSGEQSNTSMVFGGAAIMKFFRRLQHGVNPDIEIQAALTEHGALNIARMLGAVEADVDGAPTSLAFLQEFLSTATDGWVLATASVRDLMAEADLHADEAGGDFAGEAERLGEAVATVHRDLAGAFGTATADTARLRERAAAMRARLIQAEAIVPELADVSAGLTAIYTAAAEHDAPVTLQRIHGDLHLGQVLRSIHRWVLIDFEGEPMAAIDARRDMDFALRDVAGMLRSFSYAGHHKVIESGQDQQLSYRANEWSERNRAAFCTGYAAVAGRDPREQDVLLRAFEADKAVYEAVYEARNRPSWLPIPLASLTRLANGGPPA